MGQDPPAESGGAPATDKTTGTFSDQTTGSFQNQTTGSFDDQTSVTPLLLSRSKFVLWGDSLTQTSFEGWACKLANRYQRRADVVNRGMSGYNSKWYLQLPEEPHDNVALCTIWFGANDASFEHLNPHHYVSIENYQTNLKNLVQKANISLHNPNIVLITAPPVHHAQRLKYQKQRYGVKATGVLERTLENSGKYAQACHQVAMELGVPCLNLWEKFQSNDNWERFLSDGLHFSPEGHEFVAHCLLETIEANFPNLAVTLDPITGQACNSGSKCQGLSTFGPYHDQIDSECPDVAMKQAFKQLATHDNMDAVSTKSPTQKKPKMDAP